MRLDNLVTYIESLVFAADHPITRSDVKYALENCFETEISPEDIDTAVEQLMAKYSEESFAIEVNEIGGGLQFMTKPAFHHVIGSHLKLITKRKLSRVALETLAIIAYKQPVTKTELEKIRGVSCDYAIQKLLEKELVVIDGRADGPGRPLMYATSPKFMDYLGLRDIKDLPKLRELEEPENSIGESAPMEDDIDLDSVEPNLITEASSSEEVPQAEDASQSDVNSTSADASPTEEPTSNEDPTPTEDASGIDDTQGPNPNSNEQESGESAESVNSESQPIANEVVSDIVSDDMQVADSEIEGEPVIDDSEE